MGNYDEKPVLPQSYLEWINYFEYLKNNPLPSAEELQKIVTCKITGDESAVSMICERIVETVNVVLNKAIKRFIKHMNESITFNELDNVSFIFKHFKSDVNKILILSEIVFLPSEFRKELCGSIKGNAEAFWKDTLGFLKKQQKEFSNSQLDDAIFLVNRIKLFQQ